MFPFDLVGAMRLRPSKYPNGELAVVNRIASALDEAQATDVQVDDNTVRFRNDFFRPFVYRGNVLTPYGSGRFEVSSEPDAIRVRYALNMARMLVPAAVGLVIVAAIILWGRSLELVVMLALASLAIFAANYVVSALFFWIWLRWKLRGLRQLQER